MSDLIKRVEVSEEEEHDLETCEECIWARKNGDMESEGYDDTWYWNKTKEE